MKKEKTTSIEQEDQSLTNNTTTQHAPPSNYSSVANVADGSNYTTIGDTNYVGMPPTSSIQTGYGSLNAGEQTNDDYRVLNADGWQ